MTQNEVLEDARDTKNLQTIQITYGNNGYPKGLGNYGVIGFNDIEEAQEFAEKYGCEVKSFKSKNGWDFWQEDGATNKPFTADDYLSDLGDDYDFVDQDQDRFVERVKERVAELMKDFDGDFSDLKKFIEDIEVINEELSDCDEHQKLILYCGKYFQTVKKTMMQYSEDTNKYAIGVFIPHNLQTDKD